MILGHKKQWQFLLKMTENKTLAHALLFSGPEGIGKKTVALEFSQYLFCQGLSRPCHHCFGCRGIINRNHPDFLFISSEENNIKINQIKKLSHFLSLKPFSAPLKIVVIDDSHLMNNSAQNSFLKTLEEPKGNALIILISSQEQLLLPTIRSRLQKIFFHPPTKKEIRVYLQKQGLKEEKINLLLELSLLKPAKIITFLNNSSLFKKEKEEENEFWYLFKKDLYLCFQKLKQVSEKDTLSILETWYRVLRKEILKTLYQRPSFLPVSFSLQELFFLVSELEKIYYPIKRTNINKRLALETFLLNTRAKIYELRRVNQKN